VRDAKQARPSGPELNTKKGVHIMEVISKKKDIKLLQVRYQMPAYNKNPYHPCGC